MVILEAGARGIPVIAPPVGAIPGLLADNCGYICRPAELQQAMLQITQDPTEAAERGNQLRSKINKSYSIEFATIAHLKIYKEATHSKDLRES
jgi:glycosyltransferase involved in cell wall biosynthesis